MTELIIVEIPVDDLKPADYNPRQMTAEQAAHLTESVQRFGLVDPIIVNRHPGRENVVIGGHMRLNVAKQLGIEVAPVVYLDLDEQQERELNLRLNKNLGEWDWDKLAEADRELLELVGFMDEELRVGLGLGVADRVVFDESRLDVLMVQPPESPNLKERLEIHCETKEEYDAVKTVFGKVGELAILEAILKMS